MIRFEFWKIDSAEDKLGANMGMVKTLLPSNSGQKIRRLE